MNNVISYIQMNWFQILCTTIIIEQAVKAEAEKRQNTKIISICDHIGAILGWLLDIINTLIKKTPPAAGGAAVLLFLLYGTAFADVSVQSALQSVNIPTTIDELQTKAVNAGYFYNWKDSKIQPTFTYNVGGNMAFSWGTFDYLDVG